MQQGIEIAAGTPIWQQGAVGGSHIGPWAVLWLLQGRER
jgi:hypothetical protein